MKLEEYKKLINIAKTKDELQRTTLLCLKEEGQTVFSKKYNKVLDLAIRKQMSFGE